MKLASFLQVLRNVPLGYDFQMHTYGPFDSDVLDDLGYAEVFGAVKERTVIQSQGYRYEIKPGKNSAAARKDSKNWLETYQEAIDWVIEELGTQKASELELYSTIVFVDRDNFKERNKVSLEKLARQVQGIKPPFAISHILRKCQKASAKGFLQSVANAQQ